jgi:hypothetical protein
VRSQGALRSGEDAQSAEMNEVFARMDRLNRNFSELIYYQEQVMQAKREGLQCFDKRLYRVKGWKND